MKKNLYFVILLFGFITFTLRVNASEYTCKYTFEKSVLGILKTYSFDYTVDDDNNSINFGSKEKIGAIIDIAFDSRYSQYIDVEKKDDNTTYKSNNDEKIKEILIKDIMNGNCARKVYVCESVLQYGLLFDGQYISEIGTNYLGVVGLDNSNMSGYQSIQKADSCYIAEIDESGSTGEIVDTFVTECEFYKGFISKDEQGNITGGNLKELYDSCNKDANCLTEYNNEKDKVKSYCSDVLKTGSYGMDPCVENCLKINEDISNIEGTEVIAGECHFSDRIIKWIANIFKWIKYIAPVLVIIFGIMDFIKAIAAQNEDEMKKAQSRFIRRLIVAALVFIVPFLIEYILTAFKIVTDNPYCGII